MMGDAMKIAEKQTCTTCDNVGLSYSEEGEFYCSVCGTLAQDIVASEVATEDCIPGGIYSVRHTRPRPPRNPVVSDFTPEQQSDYYYNLVLTYVFGLQSLITLQCEALVDKFSVNPVICGISAPIWFRYLRSTRVLSDEWVEEMLTQLQLDTQGHKKKKKSGGGGIERMNLLWHKAVQERLPLSCTLAICYLSCHVAREPVLPTDIDKWALEGKLPYINAFPEIQKRIPCNKESSLLSIEKMFSTNSQAVPPVHKIESFSATIGNSVGLRLPPVNFAAIASRYLKQLGLPVDKVYPAVQSVYDWSMPLGLHLSTVEGGVPSRVSLMAILIVTVRILYNLNGFGKWEASLSVPIGSSEAPPPPMENTYPFDVHILEHEAPCLLRDLRKRCSGIADKFDYSKDFESYLRYCKDVVFGGSKPVEDHVEEGLIKRLWDIYVTGKEEAELGQEEAELGQEEGGAAGKKQMEMETDEVESVDKSIRLMKLEMEQNNFHYIPPRKERGKRLDYLRYYRKKEEGSLVYAAHADYYILAQAFAKEAQVDIRIMHQAVLALEKSLHAIEKRVDHCLHRLATE